MLEIHAFCIIMFGISTRESVYSWVTHMQIYPDQKFLQKMSDQGILYLKTTKIVKQVEAESDKNY